MLTSACLERSSQRCWVWCISPWAQCTAIATNAVIVFVTLCRGLFEGLDWSPLDMKTKHLHNILFFTYL